MYVTTAATVCLGDLELKYASRTLQAFIPVCNIAKAPGSLSCLEVRKHWRYYSTQVQQSLTSPRVLCTLRVQNNVSGRFLLIPMAQDSRLVLCFCGRVLDVMESTP
jgi:hypothetical protein